MLGRPHSGGVEHYEDPFPSSPTNAPETPVDRAFAAIVRALAVEDPRFVRRVTTPGPGGLGTSEVMVAVGVLATVLLGILPLALGLQIGVVALLVLGAIGSVVLPLGAPLAVRALLRRTRPMMG